MREFYEFVISEDQAHRLFNPDEGDKKGLVRRITMLPNDNRIPEMVRINKELEAEGEDFFFLGPAVHRKYSKSELSKAELLMIDIDELILAGEMFGTVYNELDACSLCGANGKQVSDLILDFRRLPKKKDIICTLACEIAVSQRLAEALITSDLKGFELHQIKHKANYDDDDVYLDKVPSGKKLLAMRDQIRITHPGWKGDIMFNSQQLDKLREHAWQEHAVLMQQREKNKRKPYPNWYQLIIVSQPVTFSSDTQFNFKGSLLDDDPDGNYLCPNGHKMGHNMTSEAFIMRQSWDGCDIIRSAGLIGRRDGYLRPRPVIFISQRMREILIQTKAKGYKLEVAHLV